MNSYLLLLIPVVAVVLFPRSVVRLFDATSGAIGRSLRALAVHVMAFLRLVLDGGLRSWRRMSTAHLGDDVAVRLGAVAISTLSFGMFAWLEWEAAIPSLGAMLGLADTELPRSFAWILGLSVVAPGVYAGWVVSDLLGSGRFFGHDLVARARRFIIGKASVATLCTLVAAVSLALARVLALRTASEGDGSLEWLLRADSGGANTAAPDPLQLAGGGVDVTAFIGIDSDLLTLVIFSTIATALLLGAWIAFDLGATKAMSFIVGVALLVPVPILWFVWGALYLAGSGCAAIHRMAVVVFPLIARMVQAVLSPAYIAVHELRARARRASEWPWWQRVTVRALTEWSAYIEWEAPDLDEVTIVPASGAQPISHRPAVVVAGEWRGARRGETR